MILIHRNTSEKRWGKGKLPLFKNRGGRVIETSRVAVRLYWLGPVVVTRIISDPKPPKRKRLRRGRCS